MKLLLIALVLAAVRLSSEQVSRPVSFLARSSGEQQQRARRWRTACPRHCVCVAGSTMCDGVALTSVPRLIQRDTHTIYMRDNLIRRLQYRRLRSLGNLRHLLLKGNRINVIENTAFTDLSRLISLSLTDNNLHRLLPGVFRPLASLKVVSIRNNKLREIDSQFASLGKLQLINLANNRIRSVAPGAFAGARHLRVVDLHRNKLTTLDPQLFSNTPHLKYLVLRDNPLRSVAFRFPPTVQLQLLDVSHCQLSAVVSGLPSTVDDLRLNNNRIREVNEHDFKDVSKIRLLVLNNNRIGFIHQKALSRLDDLYDLYVGKNQLYEVPRVPNNIHAVYANYNNISKLREGTFTFSTRLEFIFLRYNQIEEVEDTAFQGMRYLRSLDLSRNQIMKLKKHTFHDLSRLELLDLTRNPLEELEDGCFSGLRTLSILQMSSVATKSSVIASTFEDLRQVLFLDLSNSSTLVEHLARSKFDLPPFAQVQDLNLMDDHLHMLPPDFPSHFPHLRVIKLLGNPWHCNKTILWLVEWIRNGSIEFFASNYMTCASPPQLRGRALQSLEEREVPDEPDDSGEERISFGDLVFDIIESQSKPSQRNKNHNAQPQFMAQHPAPAKTAAASGSGAELVESGASRLSDESVASGEKQELDSERMRELRQGSTFHEVSRSRSALNLFDDSSGYVTGDEFVIV